MKKKTVVLLSAAIVLSLLVSSFIHSQTNLQQTHNELTGAEFIDILIKVLGREDLLPVGATLSDKIRLLEDLGYAPPEGWRPERVFTKGDTDAVLTQILKTDTLSGIRPENAELSISRQELHTSINESAATSAIPAAPAFFFPFMISVSFFLP